jgi:hypothetical protein
MDKREISLICRLIRKYGFYTENKPFGNKIKMNRSSPEDKSLVLPKTNFPDLYEI